MTEKGRVNCGLRVLTTAGERRLRAAEGRRPARLAHTGGFQHRQDGQMGGTSTPVTRHSSLVTRRSGTQVRGGSQCAPTAKALVCLTARPMGRAPCAPSIDSGSTTVLLLTGEAGRGPPACPSEGQ